MIAFKRNQPGKNEKRKKRTHTDQYRLESKLHLHILTNITTEKKKTNALRFLY